MNKGTHDEQAFLADLSPRLFPKGEDGTTHKLKLRTAPPEGYFDALPEQVMARIAAPGLLAAAPRKVPFVNVRNLSIAAAVALIIALIPLLRHAPDTEAAMAPEQMAWATADDEIWLEYLGEEALMWERADLEQYAEVHLPDNLTAEDLENYLLDENIPEEWIIDEINRN